LLLAEQAAVAVHEFSMVQLQLHPFRHVGSAGVDTSRGAGIVERFQRKYL